MATATVLVVVQSVVADSCPLRYGAVLRCCWLPSTAGRSRTAAYVTQHYNWVSGGDTTAGKVTAVPAERIKSSAASRYYVVMYCFDFCASLVALSVIIITIFGCLFTYLFIYYICRRRTLA